MSFHLRILAFRSGASWRPTVTTAAPEPPPVRSSMPSKRCTGGHSYRSPPHCRWDPRRPSNCCAARREDVSSNRLVTVARDPSLSTGLCTGGGVTPSDPVVPWRDRWLGQLHGPSTPGSYPNWSTFSVLPPGTLAPAARVQDQELPNHLSVAADVLKRCRHDRKRVELIKCAPNAQRTSQSTHSCDCSCCSRGGEPRGFQPPHQASQPVIATIGSSMKSAKDRMDIMSACRQVGSYRAAANVCGITHKIANGSWTSSRPTGWRHAATTSSTSVHRWRGGRVGG